MYEFDAAFKVLPKAGVGFAVLTVRALSDAVGEDGFEAVVVGATYIGVMVDDEARELLAHCLPHNAGLAMVNMKPFIVRDGGYMRGEALRAVVQRAAREGEIVGVPGIGRADGLGESEEAAVHPVSAEVGEGG